ncbi:hypothetical protein BO79DRAFT_255988 [Aspergillus costaricaensis CBS 115574]|uniref:Uncharacterized protein n=1 Tax=Aspergillus costaricaensis CBS 115574 TaxID=1448317 RepID=A0ACD1ICK0_9EURO|nr:hypothetical protein BO79DRAFT_255988 [Aspergillus costaricaensis CBS 115574]RAK87819.1 hypothetical protein BO79DRAFT_255988 [Aspergillus costaricaensis CBS 115574]
MGWQEQKYATTYPTRTQTVDYSSDTVSTAAEDTESEEISVQTPDPAVPNLPESSTIVKSLHTSVEDIEQTKSQISIPLLTDGKQGETPSLENDISRVTSGQSIDSTDGESGVTATRPPQILQGASTADMVGLSESSGVYTVTTEYRSPANPESMVTLLKSTTADSGTRLTSESILDQVGIIFPSSMSSLLQEVSTMGLGVIVSPQ